MSSLAKKQKTQDGNESDGSSTSSLAEDSERDDTPPDEMDKNSTEMVGVECFKDLYFVSPIYKCLKEYNGRVTPLSLIGVFLNYTGNHLLHHLSRVQDRQVFFPCHKVVSVQILLNGEFLTTAIKKEVHIDGSTGEVRYLKGETKVKFISKGIVVSNGGKQTLHPAFYKEWFPFMK